MSINLNDIVPVAPAGKTNVTWSKDGSGNVSASVPTSAIEVTVSSIDLLAQGANISATDLVAAGAVVAGLYRVTVFIIVTRAATSSSTMPKVTITWTDKDNSTPQTFDVTASNAGNLLTTFAQGSLILDAKTAVAVQYATASFA